MKDSTPRGGVRWVDLIPVRALVRLITRQPLRLLAKLVPELQRLGLSLRAMDLLIAAHALALDRPLVSLDQAFAHVPGLECAFVD